MRRRVSLCIALASCAKPAQQVEPAPSEARGIAKAHPVEPACVSRPQPSDAATERSGALQIAAWDDPECETLNVIATNVGDESLVVWDEPIRWALDEGRLHAEPVPEQGAGEVRDARMNMYTCCNQMVPAGASAELAVGHSFRWTVSTKRLETNDTRLLCNGHAPVWASHSLELDAIDVTVRAARASKFTRSGDLRSEHEMRRGSRPAELTVALARTVTIQPFEAELPLRDPEDE